MTNHSLTEYDFNPVGSHQEVEYRGLKIEVHYDESPESPREWSNTGTMFLMERGNVGVDEGDDFGAYQDEDDFLAYLRKEKDARIVLPVYCYDHSGRVYSTGPFSCPWDSGQAGIIYATGASIREALGVKRITAKGIERATEYLTSEVDTYSQWAQGDIYGYVVESPEGETLDSCWGFYGMADVVMEAKAVADSCADDIARNGTFVLDGVA